MKARHFQQYYRPDPPKGLDLVDTISFGGGERGSTQVNPHCYPCLRYVMFQTVGFSL